MTKVEGLEKSLSRKNNFVTTSVITIAIAIFICIIGYVSSERSNATTLEQIQKDVQLKASRSKVNFAASWIMLLDSNKSRASAYYQVVTEPSDITRGDKQ